jgi:hypothetical protein
MAGCKFADHVTHLRAIKRSQGDCAVMRAHSPGRPEFGPGGDENEQGRQGTAFSGTAQDIECSWIGPMHIFKHEHRRLSSRAGDCPIDERCQLSAPQHLGL